MAEPADPRAIADGVARFDHGDYWHAHEAWETAWRGSRHPHRDLLKGLIQAAAIAHHLRRGRVAAIAVLAARARGHLHAHRDAPWPIDHVHLDRLDRWLIQCQVHPGRTPLPPPLGRW